MCNVLLTNCQEISAYFTVLCNFFSVWGMREYCTVAVCHNGSKKRPERVSGNYHSKIKGPRAILESLVTSPG